MRRSQHSRAPSARVSGRSTAISSAPVRARTSLVRGRRLVRVASAVRAAVPAARPRGGIRDAAENARAMVVLGIDPGLAATGYGVVRRAGGRLVALDGGVIATPAGLAAERRLAAIHARVDELLAEHEPDALAL